MLPFTRPLFGNIFFSQGIQCEDVLRVFVKDFAGDGKVDRSACPVEELCLVISSSACTCKLTAGCVRCMISEVFEKLFVSATVQKNLEFMIFHSHGFILYHKYCL